MTYVFSSEAHICCYFTAYFNPLDCTKLLTTDQQDQIRVYSSCDWSKPQQIIQHPHRQFQHLTPIKVCQFSAHASIHWTVQCCHFYSLVKHKQQKSKPDIKSLENNFQSFVHDIAHGLVTDISCSCAQKELTQAFIFYSSC